MPNSGHLDRRVARITASQVRWLVASLLASSMALASAVGASTPLRLSERSNHHTVSVTKGSTITVILHNTYWTLSKLLPTSALDQKGSSKVVAASLAGSGCVPGQGCGTVIAHFVARHAGYARLSATRTSCGEALRCTPAQGHWTVVVHVRK